MKNLFFKISFFIFIFFQKIEATIFTPPETLNLKEGEMDMPKTSHILLPTLPQTATSVLINEYGQMYVTATGSEMLEQIGHFTFYNSTTFKRITAVGQIMDLVTAATPKASK